MTDAVVSANSPDYTGKGATALSLDIHGGLRVLQMDASGVPIGSVSNPIYIISNGGTAIIGHVIVDSGTITAITNAVTLGAASVLIGHVDGAAASGASVSGNPVFMGGRAENAEPTAVTNGQAVGAAYDVVGRAITWPYANKEQITGGKVTQTGTTAGTILAAQGAGVKFYATSVIISNSGTVGSEVTFNDSIGIPFPAPASGGVVLALPTPLVFPANTAVTATPTVASTSIKTALVGFTGT